MPRFSSDSSGLCRLTASSKSLPSMRTAGEKKTTTRNATPRVLKEGWAMKQGLKKNWITGSKPWDERWITVWSNGKIEWRTQRHQIEPNNFINITQYRVAEPLQDRENIRGYKFIFSLVHKRIDLRDLVLRTKTMREAEQWTSALVSSIGIPRFQNDTSGYRFICPLTSLKTDADVIRTVKPVYRTHKKKGSKEALQIGEGSFAGVYRVTRLRDGVQLACKRVDVPPPDVRLSHLDEIQIMRRLDHPHIVRLLDCYVTTKNTSGDVAYLFMEYCSGGTVIERLRVEPGGVFTNVRASDVTRQLLSALSYMHTKGYVHRDIKLENLLFRTPAKDSDVVLVDFGISRSFRDRRRMMTSPVGTPWYLAPEQMGGHYDEKCDVWAVGICTFWMLAGHPPFGWKDVARLQRKYGSLQSQKEQMLLDKRVSEAIQNAVVGAKKPPPVVSWGGVRAGGVATRFVHALLNQDPSKRPSAVEAIDLPWLHRTIPKIRLPVRVKLAICDLTRRDFFENAALIIIAHTIERSKLIEALRLFEAVDTSGNGQLSREEWTQLLLSNNIPRAVALQSYDLMDFDGNGKLRVSEFVAATMDARTLLTPLIVEAAFRALDIDNKGYVTERDVVRVLTYVEDEEKEEVGASSPLSMATKPGQCTPIYFSGQNDHTGG
eukprot:g4030.t1